MEPENAERLPPVRKLKPSEPVSPMIGRTLSYGMPSSSAATIASDARRPPMSGVPAISDTVPSSFTVSEADVSPPMLNQKPEATPRPCHLRSGVFQCSVFLIELSVSSMPIGPNFGPYAAFVPSRAAFIIRSSIGSRPSFLAISSTTLSTANSEIGAPGAR